MTQVEKEQLTEVAKNPMNGGSISEGIEASGLSVDNEIVEVAALPVNGDYTLQSEAEAHLVADESSNSIEQLNIESPIVQVDEITSHQAVRFVVGCRVRIEDGEAVLVLIRKKRVENFCDLTDDTSFDDKPKLIQFVFDKDEANRIIRFLRKLAGVEVSFQPLDSEETIIELNRVAESLLSGVPGIWEMSDKHDTENLLNFEIEGVCDATTREAHTEAADDERFDNFEKLISVTPIIKLDAVSTDTLTPEGSKSKRIFELLKELISPVDSEVIANGTTIARPLVLDVNGHFVCGLADGLRADQSDLYVFSYPVEEELDDDRRAFRMISEARGIADLSKETIKTCMTIMYEDLRSRTGQRAKEGQENAILNLAEHWSKFTNCSIHNSQRELTDSRELLGLKQSKTYDSAGHEETQAIEDAVNRVISQIAAEMQLLVDKSLYLQNRFRSRLKERVSKQCKKLKSVAKKSGGRK